MTEQNEYENRILNRIKQEENIISLLKAQIEQKTHTIQALKDVLNPPCRPK